MTVRELIDLLSDAYVVYELSIRNVNMLRMTLSGRKERLVNIIEEEDANPEPTRHSSHLAADADLRFSRAFLDELTSLFRADDVRNASLIDARLRFLISRVERIQVVDNTTESYQKQFLLNEFEHFSSELSRIAVSLNGCRSDSSFNNSNYQTPPHTCGPLIGQTMRAPSTKGSAVWKWDLRFSGDDKQSASEFLQNVRDYSHSRGVAEADLLRSISDLMTGSARKWFRTNTVPFSNWSDFTNRFLKDFEPMYESDRLLDAIKKRIQKPDESIIQFLVAMEDLFLRLPTVMNEVDRVKIVRANLLPRYVSALAVYQINSLWELKESCKRIEAADMCLRERPPSDPPVSASGYRPQYSNRTNQPARYGSGTQSQFQNPRQSSFSNQNANYRQPQTNPRTENAGQIAPYVPNQTATKNVSNYRSGPITNLKPLPNNQQPGHSINCLELYPSNADISRPQAANQLYPNSAYPTYQPYPLNSPLSSDQLYSGNVHAYQPVSALNHRYYVNPLPNSYTQNQIPFIEQVGHQSHVAGYSQIDNVTRPQNTETHAEQICPRPNIERTSTDRSNSTNSGNDWGTVGNGPTTVPNA